MEHWSKKFTLTVIAGILSALAAALIMGQWNPNFDLSKWVGNITAFIRSASEERESSEEVPTTQATLIRCLSIRAKLTRAETLEKYEEVRFLNPGFFYATSRKVWFSKGTNLEEPELKACLAAIAAKKD